MDIICKWSPKYHIYSEILFFPSCLMNTDHLHSFVLFKSRNKTHPQKQRLIKGSFINNVQLLEEGESGAVWHFHTKKYLWHRGRGFQKSIFLYNVIYKRTLLLHTKNKTHQKQYWSTKQTKTFSFPFCLIDLRWFMVHETKQAGTIIFKLRREKKTKKRENCNFFEWNFLNCCK